MVQLAAYELRKRVGPTIAALEDVLRPLESYDR